MQATNRDTPTPYDPMVIRIGLLSGPKPCAISHEAMAPVRAQASA